MNAIEVNGVGKNYGKVQALSDVTFGVRQGEVFGLTTAARHLCSATTW